MTVLLGQIVDSALASSGQGKEPPWAWLSERDRRRIVAQDASYGAAL